MDEVRRQSIGPGVSVPLWVVRRPRSAAGNSGARLPEVSGACEFSEEWPEGETSARTRGRRKTR